MVDIEGNEARVRERWPVRVASADESDGMEKMHLRCSLVELNRLLFVETSLLAQRVR